MKLDELRLAVNLTTKLDDSKLAEIGTKVVQGYEEDLRSRSDWETRATVAMDLAMQKVKPKDFPWTNCCNVYWPLITKAAIDYAARQYPEIVQGKRLVKITTHGTDPQDLRLKKSKRVGEFIAYQLLEKNDEWETGTDSLLHMLPVYGIAFRKVYYDLIDRRIRSELINPFDIILNNHVKSLDTARRITHRIYMYPNDIIERQRAGLFDEDVDVKLLRSYDPETTDADEARIEILEQHCYLDLDDDGYSEPYIVTVHKETCKVLRIFARFAEVTYNDKNEFIKIIPDNYFVDYHFIRSPDGGYYSIGFGTLLAPFNHSINSILNQLVDSGTLANSQMGFIGRGLRIKSNELRMKMGEYTVVDPVPGTSIRDNVFVPPFKEPSNVLFQLLGLLVEVGKDVTSSQDVLQGKGQTQNVPATTILTLVEQGLKVYNGIHKRQMISFTKEFKKVYKLNQIHLSDDEYQSFLNQPIPVAMDFTDQNDICPVSDPSSGSDVQRLAKAQLIREIPGLDPWAQTHYYLESLGLDEELINRLHPPMDPNAPPPPEAQKLMAEIEELLARAEKHRADAGSVEPNIQLKAISQQTLAKEAEARIGKMYADSKSKQTELQVKAVGELNANEQARRAETLKMYELANNVTLEHIKANKSES